MSAEMDRRVAGMSLMSETTPLGAIDQIVILDRPHEPVRVREARRKATGAIVLAETYPDHRPTVRHEFPRVPLQRRVNWYAVALVAGKAAILIIVAGLSLLLVRGLLGGL